MKKKGLIISAAVLLLIAAGLFVAWRVLSTTYTVDKSLITADNDNRIKVKKEGGYIALTKTDSAGNPSDEEIKVLCFTDTHLDAKKEKGDITLEYIIKNIVEERPDLVVFVGDNITAGFNRLRVKQFCKILEKLNVYWAAVPGNHEGDNIYSMKRSAMFKKFASYEHCLIDTTVKYTSGGEKVWGTVNYVINLQNASGKTYRSLFFIDGGDSMSEEDMKKYDAEFSDKNHNDYDYVKESQITWYKETVADINEKNGANVPSVIFDHIPLPEYKTAYEEATGETEITLTEISSYPVVSKSGTLLLMGQRLETICFSGHNSGLFDAMLETGSTDLFVCGHDHINDFIVQYKTIVLAYCAPSGYSSYNTVSKGISDTLRQGCTRFLYRTDGSFAVEHLRNADRWPEGQEAIKKLYK